MEPQGSVQEAEPEHQPRVFLGVWYSFHYVLLREWEWERNWLNDWLDRAKSLRISLPDNSPSFPLTNILVCLAWGQSRGKSALGSLCSPMTPTCVLFSLPAHSPPFPCPQSPNILSVCLSVCLSVSFSVGVFVSPGLSPSLSWPLLSSPTYHRVAYFVLPLEVKLRTTLLFTRSRALLWAVLLLTRGLLPNASSPAPPRDAGHTWHSGRPWRMKSTLENVKIKRTVRTESSKKGFLDYICLPVYLTLKLN